MNSSEELKALEHIEASERGMLGLMAMERARIAAYMPIDKLEDAGLIYSTCIDEQDMAVTISDDGVVHMDDRYGRPCEDWAINRMFAHPNAGFETFKRHTDALRAANSEFVGKLKAIQADHQRFIDEISQDVFHAVTPHTLLVIEQRLKPHDSSNLRRIMTAVANYRDFLLRSWTISPKQIRQVIDNDLTMLDGRIKLWLQRGFTDSENEMIRLINQARDLFDMRLSPKVIFVDSFVVMHRGKVTVTSDNPTRTMMLAKQGYVVDKGG